jgi:hypothetical protein
LRFRSSNIPSGRVEITPTFDLLAESFKWNAATILACAGLGLHPFDASDKHTPRALVAEILQLLSQGHKLLQRSPRLTDRPLQLSVDGVTRQEISTLN